MRCSAPRSPNEVIYLAVVSKNEEQAADPAYHGLRVKPVRRNGTAAKTITDSARVPHTHAYQLEAIHPGPASFCSLVFLLTPFLLQPGMDTAVAYDAPPILVQEAPRTRLGRPPHSRLHFQIHNQPHCSASRSTTTLLCFQVNHHTPPPTSASRSSTTIWFLDPVSRHSPLGSPTYMARPGPLRPMHLSATHTSLYGAHPPPCVHASTIPDPSCEPGEERTCDHLSISPNETRLRCAV